MGDVFILGAGASMPYGFPNGDGLLRYLQGKTYNDEDQLREMYLYSADSENNYRLTTSGHSNKKHLSDKWLRLLNESVILTIDQFLKNHADDKELFFFGKMAIAQSILEFENRRMILQIPNEGDMKSIDWIQYLLTEIDKSDSWQDILLQTTFITYNYDRVLEKFLYQYLCVDKGMGHDDGYAFIGNMKILHINGYIGALRDVPFGDMDIKKLHTVAKSIQTVWDQKSEEKIVIWAREQLEKAERIFILGTSYIKQNYDLISFDRITGVAKPYKNIRGTGYGLSDYQIKRAIGMIGHNSPSYINSILNITALDLIKDFYCM